MAWIILIVLLALVAFLAAWLRVLGETDFGAQPAASSGSRRQGEGPLSQQWLLLYTAGVFLLAPVCLLPDAGARQGRSFLALAQGSLWNHWWDWAAAWCSCKVILLSLGGFFVLGSLSVLLGNLRRKKLANAVLCLGLGPTVVFCLGAYDLLKALL